MGVETFRGSRAVCHYWRNGRCNRNPCSFLHVEADRRNAYIRDPKQTCNYIVNQHKDIYNGQKKSSVFARLHGVIEGGVVVKRGAKSGSRAKILKGASGPLAVTDLCDHHAPVVEALASSGKNPAHKDIDNGPKKSSVLAGRLHGVIEEVVQNTKISSRVKSLKGASGPPVVTDVCGVASDAPIVKIETLASSEENPVDKPCASWKSGSCPRFEGEGFSLVANLEGHTKVITGIGVPSGSDKLYSGSYDGTVRVWDCHSGQSVTVVNLVDEVGSLICEGVWVFVGIPNAVKAWDTETATSLSLDGPVGQVYSMIVAVDMLFAGLQDGTIVVWKVSNEKPNPFKLAESLKGHTAHVTCLATGNMKLYSGSSDCTIRIWDLQNLHCTRILNGHSEAVKSLVLCNEYLLSCSLDRTIKIWAKDGGDGDATLTHIEEHGAIALGGIQDKPILLCSLDDNSIHFYELPSFTDRGKIFSGGEVKTIQNGPFGLFFTGDGSGTLSVWKTD